MDTNLDGLNLSLKELKNHLDALGITKPEELNSLRKIWRQKFKYLSNIEWSSSTKLNESLQNLESAYSCLESIDLDDLKELLILHSEYLFGSPTEMFWQQNQRVKLRLVYSFQKAHMY